jgi:endonuclease-8
LYALWYVQSFSERTVIIGRMAEGDTILRAARRIDAALAGQSLAASAPHPRGRAAGVERLDGHRLERVSSHGKNLLLHCGDLVLHSHMGMNGSWHVYPRGARWRKPRRSAWAVLAGEAQDAVQFGGPTLRVIPAARLARDPQLARLGPDILAPGLDLGAAVRSLRADPARALGDALLDQALVAGIGNIFKSEACFAARLDPWRPVGDLSDEELWAVLAAARSLMLEAVASGRHSYAVYRARRPCPSCGGPIASRGQGDANRTTYWCPLCQG